MKITKSMKKELKETGSYTGKAYYYTYNWRKGIVKKYTMWSNGAIAELKEEKEVNWNEKD